MIVSASIWVPYDPMLAQPEKQLLLPSYSHWFGTDYLGRDVFSRLVFGGQRTLYISALGTIVALTSGGIVGLLAGIAQNKWRSLIEILIDVWLGFPPLLLTLMILMLFNASLLGVIVGTGFMQMMPVAVYVSVKVRELQTCDYWLASHALGASWKHLIKYHLSKTVETALLNYSGAIFAYVLIASSTLSFLGLSGNSEPDWGIMLMEARYAIRTAGWLAIPPFVAIVLTTYSIMSASEFLSRNERSSI